LFLQSGDKADKRRFAGPLPSAEHPDLLTRLPFEFVSP
jgi:hypothetical protein